MSHCKDHQHHHRCDHHQCHVDHVEVIVEASQTIDHDEHHQIHDNAADEGLQREAGISVLHHRSSPSAPAQESPMVVQLLRRRFRGQRKYKRAEPAIASASPPRSEEHTSELQSLMRNSYAVCCLKKNTCYDIYNQTNNVIKPSTI